MSEEHPKITKYQQVLKKYCEDGVITTQEEKQLTKLRNKFGIDQQTHEDLLAELLPSEEVNVQLYVDVRSLKQATLDGMIRVAFIHQGEWEIDRLTVKYRLGVGKEQQLECTSIFPDQTTGIQLKDDGAIAGVYGIRGTMHSVDLMEEENFFCFEGPLFYRTVQIDDDRLFTPSPYQLVSDEVHLDLLGEGSWCPISIREVNRAMFEEWSSSAEETFYQKNLIERQANSTEQPVAQGKKKKKRGIVFRRRSTQPSESKSLVQQEDVQPEVLDKKQDKAVSIPHETTLQLDLDAIHARGVQHEKDNEFTKAVQCYRKAAELGHPPSQNLLGDCYDAGRGVSRDQLLAVQWYRKAEASDYPAAIRNLGHCYACGHGVEKDTQKSFQAYQKAAQLGDIAAMYSLGECYADGDGVKKSKGKSRKWFGRTLELALKASEQGNPHTMYILGEMYLYGEGVEMDEEKAVEWYRKSALLGNSDAMHSLGECCTNGFGVEEDPKEAVAWYTKAHENGNVESTYKLGKIYYKGIGVPKNKYKASVFLCEAADQDHKGAQKFIRKKNVSIL